jgi:two-component system nitrogen regulation response regulator NtrX
MSTVLIVDDQEVAREALQVFFDAQGATCLAAAESEAALKALAERQPDLVFLDIKLDGSRLDGLQILEEAGKLPHRAKMKIVMVTGYPDPETEAKAKALGADGFLVKPVGIEKLVELFKQVGG